jgi:hypothetical protein
MSSDRTFRLRRIALEHPALRSLYLQCRPAQRPLAPGPATQLVVEGFPRSANTYAFAALAVANPGIEPAVSHHLHSTRSIAWAGRHRRACILLVREPVGAVVSLCLRYPAIRPATALLEHAAFHRRVQPLLEHVVVAPFPLVTSDFGAVVDQVNRRFGTSVRRYERTSENEARVARIVEDLDRRENGGSLFEHTVARPSARRRDLAARTEELVRVAADHLAEAEDAVRALSEAARS